MAFAKAAAPGSGMSPDRHSRENGEETRFLVLMHLTQHQLDSGNTCFY